MAEACGSRIYGYSEFKGVTRNRTPSKVTERNMWVLLLPTSCPRVSSCSFPLRQYHINDFAVRLAQSIRHCLRVDV